MVWVSLVPWLLTSLCCLTVESVKVDRLRTGVDEIQTSSEKNTSGLLALQEMQEKLMSLVSELVVKAENATRTQEKFEVIGPHQIANFTDGDKLQHIAPTSWMKLRGRIGTVCVGGDDRQGKSTLLSLWGRSKLKSNKFNFSLGHNEHSHTKGIWSAILPKELTNLDFHLNLCDSQGLKQVDNKTAHRIFTANVLLPQVLVYLQVGVVQNDQIRDLSNYAYLFKHALSKDYSGRFKSTLSPHLIVLIKDVTSVCRSSNMTAHLEEVLSGPSYPEEKALIRQVFSTREAWVLDEMPKSSRQALHQLGNVNTTSDLLPFHDKNKDGEDWRTSGLEVLDHVLAAMQKRSDTLPDGGSELMQWHESVFETVNSETNLIARLSFYSEVLGTMNQRRVFLQGWTLYLQFAFAIISLLLAFGGFLGVWLDRVAWGVWLILCVTYIGSSPFVTMSLHGFVPALCVQALRGNMMMKYVCQEFSAPTAAVLLAVILGIVTYPLFTTLLSSLTETLPLPSILGKLNKQHAALLLSVLFAGLGFLDDISMPEQDDTSFSLYARGILIVVALASGTEFGAATRKNGKRKRKALEASVFGHKAAMRIPEVLDLHKSDRWRSHFRSLREYDSLWRYRPQATWLYGSVCLQAGALLVWAHIIRPYFDPVLTVGVTVNVLYLCWCGGAPFVRCLRRNRQKDPVEAWTESLPDDDLTWQVRKGREADVWKEKRRSGQETLRKLSEYDVIYGTEEGNWLRLADGQGYCLMEFLEKADDEEPDFKECLFVDESPEEVEQRREIEAMRREEELGKPSSMPYMGLGCLFLLSVALAFELGRNESNLALTLGGRFD